MVILSKTLNRKEEASLENIVEIINYLEGKWNPTALLQENKNNYMMVLWTEDGYIIIYQSDNRSNRFKICNNVSKKEAIFIFQSYFNKDNIWKSKYKFQRMDISIGLRIMYHLIMFFVKIRDYFLKK